MPRLSLQIIVESADFRPENVVELAREQNIEMDLFIVNPKDRTIEGFMSEGGSVVRVNGSGDFLKDLQDTLDNSPGEYFAIVRSNRICSMETITRMIEKAEHGYDIVVASRYSDKKRRFDLKTAIIKLLVREMNVISDPLSPFFIARKSMLYGIDLSTSPETILPELIIKNRSARISEIQYGREISARAFAGGFFAYAFSLLRLSRYRAVKFGLVGITGIGINEGAEYLFHSLSGLIIPVALLLSIEISILWNFTFNNVWTFSDRRHGSVILRLLRYNTVTALGATVNYVVGLSLVPFMFYLYANLIGIFLGFLVNYLGSDYLVWKIEKD